MNGNAAEVHKQLWTPKASDGAPLKDFMKRIESEHEQSLDNDYWKLHRWSCDNFPEFWAAVWDFCGVKSSQKFDEVIEANKGIADFPRWFLGAKLNYAENVLHGAGARDEDVALEFVGESMGDGESRSLTWGQLRRDVAAYASALRSRGIAAGDRIVSYGPNSPETLTSFLATASIGAVWSSASPDFGVTAVLERFRQLEPKLLFTTEGVVYNGKLHSSLPKLREIHAGLPSLCHVVLLPFLSRGTSALAKGAPTLSADELTKEGWTSEEEFRGGAKEQW